MPRPPDGESYLRLDRTVRGQQLGVEEDLVEEIACMAMEPEGRISIIDSYEDDAPSVLAFTRDGIDYLRETLGDPASCYDRPSVRP